MRASISYGNQQHLDLEIDENRLVRGQRQGIAPPLNDPAAAMREALETPRRFPALRQALTPDDHIAVVVDPLMPRLTDLLLPVLEHITSAGILPEAITLVAAPPGLPSGWQEKLPGLLREVRSELHDGSDRDRLSYLATTKEGRRVYLNRTAVDADQLILLGARGYDPLLGYSGAEGLFFPGLADEAARQELTGRLSVMTPGKPHPPTRQEAQEVGWLLGTPLLIQVIPGGGDEIVHIVAGLLDSAADGEQLLDARWRETIDRRVGTVVAGLSGDPAKHDLADLARAASCAARVVETGGRIVILSETAPALGPGVELLRQANDPARALALLKQNKPVDMAAAFQWASAARHARIYLLSGLEAEVAEELFATPLEHPTQVQRLLDEDGSYLFIQDAHRALAVATESRAGGMSKEKQ